jgi:hypothetical protein
MAAQKVMKKNLAKKVVNATGVPTVLSNAAVKKILSLNMKPARSNNLTNAMRWSHIVDVIKGHFNVSTPKAVKAIVEAGFNKCRFPGLRHTNGIKRGNTFMIAK